MTARPLILELTDEGARGDARARLVAASVTLPGSLALLLDDPGPVRVTVALAGVLASVFWALRARRALSGAVRVLSTLVLDDAGLRIDSPGGALACPYDAIADLDLHDDAAGLVLEMRDGTRHVIEPGHGGLDAPSLANLLRRRMQGGNPDSRG